MNSKQVLIFLDKVRDYSPLVAMRQGFILVLPLTIIGVFALVLLNIPIPAFHHFLDTVFGDYWRVVCLLVHKGSFGMAALALLVCSCYSYITQLATLYECKYLNHQVATVVCLASYFILIIPSDGLISMDLFSFKGGLPIVFFIVVVCPPLFLFLYRRIPLNKYIVSASFESSVGEALAAGPAAFCVIFLFVILRLFLGAKGMGNVFEGAQSVFSAPFDGDVASYVTGLKYIGFSQCAWFFGLHGPHLLSSLESSLFDPALQQNIAAAGLGLQGQNIFTKPFLDIFVHTGGSGATLGLIIALFLQSRDLFSRRLAWLSFLPVVFNVNEILIFGLPLVFNPLYFIPFLLAPLLQYSLAYMATLLHFVPVISENIHWTTPAILGGYMVTGTYAGAILQGVCVLTGVLVYLPFVRLANFLYSSRLQSEMIALSAAASAVITRPSGTKCIDLPRQTGHLARVLSVELEQALLKDTSQLSLEYQPQIDTSKYCVSGAEALVRWHHPVYGEIPGHIAVALAEDTGLIHKLGMHVLQAACNYQASSVGVYAAAPHISINFSVKQFEDESLVDTMSAIFEETGVDPHMIKVEVTETVATTPGIGIESALTRMRRMGIRVAIDDFGMGHTSLRYLREFPVDYIKIDRSLTLRRESGVNDHIVKSIVQLCEAMNIGIIVEGVETLEQVKRFRAFRCNLYQGYYFSKVLSGADYTSYLLDFEEDDLRERLGEECEP